MAVLEDRVSAKPGRMLVKPEGGAEFYAQLEMADEPVAPGNKLNRQNVIDTLLPVSENGGVGTVVWTAAQNVDDRWLECDGSEVLAAEHAELAEVLPEVPLRPAGVQKITVPYNGGNMLVYGMKYVNGYYIALSGGCIAYSKTLDGEWQFVTVGVDNNWDIIYAGGYWVLYTGEGGGSKDYGYIYYATELDGPWTLGASLAKKESNVGRLFYQNGQYIAIVDKADNSQTVIYAATNVSSWSASGSVSGSVIGLAYSQKRKRWEMALKSNTAVLWIAYSTDLINWTVSEQYYTFTTDIPEIGAASSKRVHAAYLGIDEEYWNVVLSVSGVSGIAAAYVSFLPDCTFVRAQCLDTLCYTAVYTGDGEMLCNLHDTYYRHTADGDFVKNELALVMPNNFSLLNVMENGQLFIGCASSSSSSGCSAYLLHGICLKYRPEITVPDATGVTKAYIKAK